MTNTPRMKWPIPRKNIDPWYADFVDLEDAQDASAYAAREDRNIIGMGGGIFNFTLSSGLITWADTLELLSAPTGFVWRLEDGEISLDEGELLYVALPRFPTDNTTVSALKATNLSVVDGDGAFVLAIRRNSKIYWRNGAVMEDGSSFQVFEATGGQGGGGGGGGGIGAPGQKIPNVITVVTNEVTDQSTYQVVGHYSLNPLDYVIDGTSTQIRFVLSGYNTLVSLTGNLQLFNLTDSSLVTTLALSSATFPTKVSTGALSLPGSEKMYEIRIRVTGGTPPADKFVCSWAGFQIDNTFLGGT